MIPPKKISHCISCDCYFIESKSLIKMNPTDFPGELKTWYYWYDLALQCLGYRRVYFQEIHQNRCHLLAQCSLHLHFLYSVNHPSWYYQSESTRNFPFLVLDLIMSFAPEYHSQLFSNKNLWKSLQKYCYKTTDKEYVQFTKGFKHRVIPL